MERNNNSANTKTAYVKDVQVGLQFPTKDIECKRRKPMETFSSAC